MGYTPVVTPRCLAAALVLAVCCLPAAAQDLEVASYDIQVTLDPESHGLEGRQVVTWRNTTGAETAEVFLHLYLNAFASSETTFMRELARIAPERLRRLETEGWGWTRITRLVLADGTDLLPGLSFERPDDGNEDDFTLARVALPGPVAPGVAITFELDFEARLPRVVARTGFAGDFHLVAQWFPKVAVFRGEDGWGGHQFHAASEFFADFGSYRVRMTVPRGWLVGATGEQVSREPVGTADLVEYRAVAVHDFAWTAAPPDLMTEVEADFEPGRDVPAAWLERASASLGMAAAELELPPMKIRLLLPRTQAGLAPRMVRASRLAVAWFGLYLGPYPYPQLTVVSPPPDAADAGGMEYPTFITTGARHRDAHPPWRWLPGIEAVTVHEFGHQYFQGLLASDESEAAWLDEGLTTWAENRCLADMVSDGLVPELLLAGDFTAERLAVAFERPPLTIDRRSWRYRTLVDYFLASYAKAGLAVRTLEGLLGEARFARALRAYVDRWRYRHPTGRDLQAAMEEATGEDLAWFFDHAVRGSALPDWAVLSVRHRSVDPARGLVWTDAGWSEREAVEGGDERVGWRIEIDVGRLGELEGPVEVELEWADGRRERRRWDGRERWQRWRVDSEVRLVQVRVDPDGVWALETRRADNSWRDEAAHPGPLWWLGPALRLAGQLALPWS